MSDLMNNLSITDGYPPNFNDSSTFITLNHPHHPSMQTHSNFLQQFNPGPIVSGVQPPPYSVAISSTSSFTSSASPPPGYPIGYSSSSSRPLQVPLDVVQASLLQANEFDQLHHMSNNRQHRRTSVPVSLGSSHLLLDLNDGTSDAIKSSNRRLNRPDVLGLRSVERQLSLPVETGSGRRLNTRGKGGHHHQHHLTHRRNNDDEDDVDVDVVVGDDDDDVNDEDENLQGHRVDSAGGLLDDDDGDNECGDDELSEYGAYPPPEPAPPDFIPSSDHSAFLSSPNIIHHQIGHNSALAVGGHTSTSSIEGTWTLFSSFTNSFAQLLLSPPLLCVCAAPVVSSFFADADLIILLPDSLLNLLHNNQAQGIVFLSHLSFM